MKMKEISWLTAVLTVAAWTLVLVWIWMLYGRVYVLQSENNIHLTSVDAFQAPVIRVVSTNDFISGMECGRIVNVSGCDVMLPSHAVHEEIVDNLRRAHSQSEEYGEWYIQCDPLRIIADVLVVVLVLTNAYFIGMRKKIGWIYPVLHQVLTVAAASLFFASQVVADKFSSYHNTQYELFPSSMEGYLSTLSPPALECVGTDSCWVHFPDGALGMLHQITADMWAERQHVSAGVLYPLVWGLSIATTLIYLSFISLAPLLVRYARADDKETQRDEDAESSSASVPLIGTDNLL
jgi:hypothetical protein